MAKKLRVLLVEDNPDDAEMITRQLKRNGYELTCTRVDTAKAMQAALQAQDWDVVLSDHNMPNFSSYGALDILKASARDIPLILVSGSIGEDEAVRVLKAGMADYLLKDRVKRLPAAIEQALHRAAERRALAFSNTILTTQQETSLDGILVVDERGKVISFNQRFVELWGVPPDLLRERDDERVLRSVLDKVVNPQDVLV